jgi:type VI secretion system protein ImpB
MPESTQHKLDRVRPPRVQITYDVEIGSAIQKKELPMVVGILADLSGSPDTPLPKLKDRKFVEIDHDTFDDVLAAIHPRLALRVPNKLSGDNTGSSLNVELRFNSLEDFNPVNILQQIEPMRKLFEARARLSDLLSKLDGNDVLEAKLAEIAQSRDTMKQLQGAVKEETPNG